MSFKEQNYIIDLRNFVIIFHLIPCHIEQQVCFNYLVMRSSCVIKRFIIETLYSNILKPYYIYFFI